MIDSKPVIMSAAVMAAAGAAVFLLLPIIIGAAMDSFGWQQQQAGLLASSYFTGYFASCIAAVFLIRQFSLKVLAKAAYVLLCVGLLAAGLMSDLIVLGLCMLVSGFGAGLLFGLAVLIAGQRPDSEQAFGILLVSQQLLAMALLFVLPSFIVPNWGFAGLMIALAIIMVPAVLSVVWLGDIPHEQKRLSPPINPGPALSSHRHGLWFGLIGLTVYFAALAGVWAFVERLGVDKGLSAQGISISLSFSMIGGVVGGLMVAILANRFGRSRPLVLSLAAFLSVFFVYSTDHGILTYAVATFLFSLFWNYVLGYQMVIISDLDLAGRYAVLIPAAQALGAVLGPGVAGLIIASLGYIALLFAATLAACLTTGVFLLITPTRAAN
jgi:predicted MFS family arabinose efflux permease